MATAPSTKPKVDDNKCVNILLCGEAGAGKSTFINAFANYLQYSSLAEATTGKLHCPVPTKFHVLTDDNKQETICMRGDETGNAKVIKASTHKTSAYAFQLSAKQWVRLIDTPGVGYGVAKDTQNMEDTLAFLGTYDHLHGICIVLKPSKSVTNKYFKSHLLQLITRLDQTIAKNIFFLITNTRPFEYKTGDALVNFQQILAELQLKDKISIPLNHNVFFCDNEGFRYAAALRCNIKCGNFEAMKSSWKVSHAATWALIDYISGGKCWKPLTPCKMQNTGSISEARRLVIALMRPLADINELIHDNLTLLEEYREKVLQENISIDELKTLLTIPGVDMKLTTLKHPMTVCTSAKCSEVYTLSGIKKYRYKKICHNPCYLNGVPKEIIGSEELANCPVMSTGKCKECGCEPSAHMHMYYEVESCETIAKTGSVVLQDDPKMVQLECIQKAHAARKFHLENYKLIVEAMTKFTYFLHYSCCPPANDVYETYLEHLIQRERLADENYSYMLVKRYEEFRSFYREQKRLLLEACKASKGDAAAYITAEDVIKTLKELRKMQYVGSRVNDLQMRQTAGAKRELKFNAEYVHDTIAKRSEEKQQSKPKQQAQKKTTDRKQLIVKLIAQNNINEAIRHMKELIEEKKAEAEEGGASVEFDDMLKAFADAMKQDAATSTKSKKKNKKQPANAGTNPININKQQGNMAYQQHPGMNAPPQMMPPNVANFPGPQANPVINNPPFKHAFSPLNPVPQMPTYHNVPPPYPPMYPGPNPGMPPSQGAYTNMYHQVFPQNAVPINLTVTMGEGTTSVQKQSSGNVTPTSTLPVAPPAYDSVVGNQGGMGSSSIFRKPSSKLQQQIDDDSDSSECSNASSLRDAPAAKDEGAVDDFVHQMQQFLDDERRKLKENDASNVTTSGESRADSNANKVASTFAKLVASFLR